MIIANKVELLLEAKRQFSPSRPIIFHHKGEKLPKRLIFCNFELINRPPNNFCAMSDGSVVICKDFFVDEVSGSSQIVGQKFLDLRDAFLKPFCSSKFGIYIGTNLSGKMNNGQHRKYKQKYIRFRAGQQAVSTLMTNAKNGFSFRCVIH